MTCVSSYKLYSDTSDKLYSDTSDKMYSDTSDKLYSDTSDKLYSDTSDKLYNDTSDKLYTDTIDLLWKLYLQTCLKYYSVLGMLLCGRFSLPFVYVKRKHTSNNSNGIYSLVRHRSAHQPTSRFL